MAPQKSLPPVVGKSAFFKLQISQMSAFLKLSDRILMFRLFNQVVCQDKGFPCVHWLAIIVHLYADVNEGQLGHRHRRQCTPMIWGKVLPICHTPTDGTFFNGTDNTELLLLSNDELSKPTSWQSFLSKFGSGQLVRIFKCDAVHARLVICFLLPFVFKGRALGHARCPNRLFYFQGVCQGGGAGRRSLIRYHDTRRDVFDWRRCGLFVGRRAVFGDFFVRRRLCLLLEGGPSSIGSDLNARLTFLHKAFLFIITCWPANAAIALSTALRHNFPLMCCCFFMIKSSTTRSIAQRTTLDPVIQLLSVGSIKRAHSVVGSLCVVYFVCL